MKVAIYIMVAVCTVAFTSAQNSSAEVQMEKRSLSLPSLSDLLGFANDVKDKKEDLFKKPRPVRPVSRPYPAYYPPPMGYPAPMAYPAYSKPSYPKPSATHYQKPAIPIRIELVLPTVPTIPTPAAAAAVATYGAATAPAVPAAASYAAPAVTPAAYTPAVAPAVAAPATYVATPAPYTAAAVATPARPTYQQPPLPQGYRSGDMMAEPF